MNEFEIVFQPQGKRSRVSLGKTIIETAKEIGVKISSICGGRGVCGKCRIVIKNGGTSVSELSKEEKRHLSEADIARGVRLACQVLITGNSSILVEVPPESRVDQHRLLLRGIEPKVSLSPAVKKFIIQLDKPSLEDTISDVDRLLTALSFKFKEYLEVDYTTLKDVSRAIREGNWKVTVTVWNDKELISIEPGKAEKLFGFALDIGTTKIAGYLVNLNDGKIQATSSIINPQITYGEDIISRIRYIARDSKNLQTLQKLVIQGINQLMMEVCEKAEILPNAIYDLTMAGNTAMHHILLGITPEYLAQMPYPPALQSPIDVKTRELGLDIVGGSYLHAIPTIAGFVGGDTVADILATRIYQANNLSMLIDIGTNTEIVLGNKSGLTSCSCASGPAFEGAHIKYGMRASTGAIENIWIEQETFKVGYKTIDDAKPCGICGSGIVAAIAEMLKIGLIERSGRFVKKHKTPRLRTNGNSAEFVLSWKSETSIANDIVITQSDIREVQLAKAAIYTGAYLLMNKMQVATSRIHTVYLAGAFGTFLDPQDAKVIGMYPDITLDRVQFVGNTAGSGARMTLKSVKERKLAEQIAKHVVYVELGAEPNFQNEFLKATYFPHQEPQRFPSINKILTRKT